MGCEALKQAHAGSAVSSGKLLGLKRLTRKLILAVWKKVERDHNA
jgi:hypothetical protein